LTDGKTIPFGNAVFSQVATANTIYFWEDPQAYATEIARVMKPGGILAIGFIPKSTMQHIPFAKYGFTLYDAEDVTKLLALSGLEVQHIELNSEFVTSNSGEQIEREIMVITAVKK
ncbi:MAG: methyltransferase domain-containing protein, partial [Bacteroidota bacterium]